MFDFEFLIILSFQFQLIQKLVDDILKHIVFFMRIHFSHFTLQIVG